MSNESKVKYKKENVYWANKKKNVRYLIIIEKNSPTLDWEIIRGSVLVRASYPTFILCIDCLGNSRRYNV